MTDHAAIDSILFPWAAKHELHVYARDRDPKLRSIIVYFWLGTRHESAGHMWIEGPGQDGQLTVHGAAPDWHEERQAAPATLESALEEMFQTMIARPIKD